MPEERRIMNVKQLSEYLGCHEATTYRLLKRHQIPGFRLMGDWRFRRESIDNWCMQPERQRMQRR
jgi:excisionase family DNA binding protein